MTGCSCRPSVTFADSYAAGDAIDLRHSFASARLTSCYNFCQRLRGEANTCYSLWNQFKLMRCRDGLLANYALMSDDRPMQRVVFE